MYHFISIYIVKLFYPSYWMIPTSLILAQAKHETGNFSSFIYKSNNNLFGMKHPVKRKTTSTGDTNGYATYLTKFDSIKDYFLRQLEFNIDFKTTDQYVTDTLKSNYAEDPNYRDKWYAHFYSLGNLRYLGYILTPSIILIPFLVYNDIKISELFKK